MRKLRGFTLVELLVVIGIIAVLISILLPSLARARQYANSIACASSIRQIGQGLLFYANDHKGKLPMGGNGGKPVDGEGWLNQWGAQVTMAMGVDLIPDPNGTGYADYGNFRGNYSAILRCPDVPVEYVMPAWNGGIHYTANVRAMPWPKVQDKLNGSTDANPFYLKPYPLATKDASSKMLLWEGAVLPDFGYNAPTCNINQMWWFITWGAPADNSWVNWWADPKPGYDADKVAPISNDGNLTNLNPGSANWIGKANRDGNNNGDEFPWSNASYALQRYRHLGETSCNFLFFDGHVESRKLGTVTFRELSIYPW
jgi:prepilin-type N-terminal cleavage/methylation domain-containing protein/prepilin-type processing-associated H-X9-DG protein